jgi:hypothetical protein
MTAVSLNSLCHCTFWEMKSGRGANARLASRTKSSTEMKAGVTTVLVSRHHKLQLSICAKTSTISCSCLFVYNSPY